MLETAPSFSIYSKNTGEGEEERENGDQINGKVLGSGDFSFVKSNMDLIKEEGDELEEGIGGLEKLGTEEVLQPASPPMYLASGIGIGIGIRDGVVDFGVERENSEEYRELLEEHPNHPLVLRNYAHFLQSKGDLEGAEYYYFRATQADPSDGEVMSQYAKLVWELHRDREKALTYFEHATQTAPEDSNVLAAYAKFLWEIDDDEQDTSVQQNDHSDLLPSGRIDISASGGGGLNESADIEKDYERMIEENPSDPLFLKSYAKFLYQSKGDLQGAEEYYSSAILADPQDGEVLSEYAKLVWELHHDQDKALVYFERAIQAAPRDSNVLAAYASFLWAIDDDDEVVEKQLDSLSHTVLAGAAGA